MASKHGSIPGWFSSLSSRKSESDLSRQLDGVELQHMGSDGAVAGEEGSEGSPRSQPMDILKQGTASGEDVKASPRRKAEHQVKPSTHGEEVIQAQRAAAAAATAAAAAQTTAFISRSGVLQHPLGAAEEAACLRSYSSAGLDLPSALTIPALDGYQDRGAGAQQQQHQEPGEQQDPCEASGCARPSKVHWLPGLSSGVVIIPNGSPSGQQQPPALQQPPAAVPAASSNDSNAGQPDESSVQPARLTSGASYSSGTGAATQRSSKPALFQSGNMQLDKYLSYLLKESHPHKHLYYPGWGISDDGCAAVGDFLRRDRRVKVVTLSDNGIRDDGVELIADGLAANSSLLCLDLSSNKIGNMGAIALAEALHSNKTLAELNLTSNRIGDDGAEALAAAVASSTALKKLHLNGNLVSSAAQRVVEHVLKTREYKMPAKPSSFNSSKHHVRKSSSLQFLIELSDGSCCQDPLASTTARSKLHQLPPATAIGALTEPTDTMESSVAMQAAHLLAELHSTAADAEAPSHDGPASAAPSSSSGLVCLLALRLAWRGYECMIRTSCPSPVSAEGVPGPRDQAATGTRCAALRHTFVRVMQPGEVSSPLVVDPAFRELFVIPHPTERYRSVLDALPRTLVLMEARLYHLVEALCNEMAAAFREQSMTCPPWRAQVPMLDKFFSESKHDVVVDVDMSLAELQRRVSC